MEQAHIYIRGIVQGVGFRQFVKSKAKRLGLTGWVQNLPEGGVEALVQGEKGRIDMLLFDINQGTPLSEVEDVDVIWEEVNDPFDDFTIEHLD